MHAQKSPDGVTDSFAFSLNCHDLSRITTDDMKKQDVLCV